MEARRGIVNACGVASALGLSFNLLWCTLMGHTPGFLLSSLGLAAWVNARTFWLVGILAITAVLVAAPRWIAAHDRSLAFVMPVIAAAGTGCFALSFHQDFFPPAVLATTGLVLSGLGYFWLASRFVLLLARTQGFASAVWCLVAAFPLRQLMSLALDRFIDPAQQVVVAIALPFLAALCFEAARAAAKRAALGDAAGEAASDARPARGAQDMVAVLVIVGVLLAMVRIFGPSGVWGDSNTTYFDTLGRIPAIAVLTVCLAAFALATLLLMAKQPASVRFQPPVLVVIAGLFVVVVRAQLGEEPNALLDSVVQANDPFAHLLFWSAVAAALVQVPWPENRVVGLAGLVYAAASVVWVVFLRGSAVVETVVILVVVALVMNRSWLASLVRGKGAPDAAGAAGEAPEDAAQRLSQSIVARCDEIAAAYALSPRETEVFTLLAQGRTCSFVQEELVLAESTVKTHMSHIYGKLGVSGRQEMMDLLFGESKEKTGA
ncbi:helix-turn-helix transcriptional regulator [Eggerthella sinensis]|uniref:helix-turn-helix transcriptional regulator n=1 Tax=Eggerthella sinensis TaxID=242230 RepID=UPI001D063716|nr:LuxR C-terminal-related transcriptional regulator [Eggerthella sinensis]MCB7038101.1 LuxR C-terminal-related transcriptional regulator [Eggerthella sinensis]